MEFVMGISIWQILIIAVVLVLLFGRGKISSLMGDVAQGIKSFKKGMAEDDEPAKLDHAATVDLKTEEAEKRKAG
jgi:sec-independent protein translocase protein TatA